MADIAATIPSRILAQDPVPQNQPGRQSLLAVTARSVRSTPEETLRDNRARTRRAEPQDDGAPVGALGGASGGAPVGAPGPAQVLGTPGLRPSPGANQLLAQFFLQAPGDEITDEVTDGATNEAPVAARQKTGIAAYRSAQSVIPPQPQARDDSGFLVVQDHPAIDLTI